MRKFTYVALILSLGLAGCGRGGNWGRGESYAQGVKGEDAPVVASSVTDFVRLKVRTDDGSIVVNAASNDTEVGSLITSNLSSSGFTIGTKGTARHELRYVVQPFEEGILVLAFIDQDTFVGTRIFKPDHTGHLQPAGQFAIRELSSDQ